MTYTRYFHRDREVWILCKSTTTELWMVWLCENAELTITKVSNLEYFRLESQQAPGVTSCLIFDSVQDNIVDSVKTNCNEKETCFAIPTL